MSFLRKIFAVDRAAPDEGLYLYVRCGACGEPIRIRVNTSSDLEPVFEDEGDDPTGYELNKEILGNRCFQLIYARWTFDLQRRKLGGEIEGGTEITAAEYEAERSAQSG